MLIAFIIWSGVAVLFILLGISAWNQKEAVGFWTGVKPPKVKDVKAYNHAVAKLWFGFAAGMELLGFPFLTAEQNSPLFLLSAVGMLLLAIIAMVIYECVIIPDFKD